MLGRTGRVQAPTAARSENLIFVLGMTGSMEACSMRWFLTVAPAGSLIAATQHRNGP